MYCSNSYKVIQWQFQTSSTRKVELRVDLISHLNRAEGVEARMWLPSRDQDRKLTPPPPTRWRGTQLSEATSHTWNQWHRYNQSDSQMKQCRSQSCLPTIMAVSIGDADTRREPLGDQAMEVTGEWPGCERTWAQPEEGLPGCRRGNANQCEHVELHLWWVSILNSEDVSHKMSSQRLSTLLTVSRGLRARPISSSGRRQRGPRHTVASTAPLQCSSAAGASGWEWWRWEELQGNTQFKYWSRETSTLLKLTERRNTGKLSEEQQ